MTTKASSKLAPPPGTGRARVVIEGVSPVVDRGQFPVKRVENDRLGVEADLFTDGHDRIRAIAQHRPPGARKWRETTMTELGNDRWRATIALDQIGRWHFRIVAWVDRFLGWFEDLEKRINAGQDLSVQFLVGAELINRVIESSKPPKDDIRRLEEWRTVLESKGLEPKELVRRIRAEDLPALMERFSDRRFLSTTEEYAVVVDRTLAAFSAWYEMFPRSTGENQTHGTFNTAQAVLPYVSELGFDILYLPPIHPVGDAFRKGKNNSLEPDENDVGSPWAIGSSEGGHEAINPDLGTFDDFASFRKAAEKLGLEIALDIAFQVSPDHPWVSEHPSWFRALPDGSIQYAENPPKKYQDIYPIDFESDDHQELWKALRDVFLFWIEKGVSIFRVDNPHTKAFAFWEWAIPSIKSRHPEAIFLSEAFTRPKMMYRLAKGGFTQSYTYFTWRTHKKEMEEYLQELTRSEVAEFFRPNFWPNTPDILHETLQHGGRPMFISRFLLASMLSSNYGIYGPAFELLEHDPAKPGSEEYLDSEKYQLRNWDLDKPESLRFIIARVNQFRRDNPALHRNDSLHFHSISSDQITLFSKRAGDNIILCAISFDPWNRRDGMTRLDLGVLGLEPGESFEVSDMLTGARYQWTGAENYIALDPNVVPAHLFKINRIQRGNSA